MKQTVTVNFRIENPLDLNKLEKMREQAKKMISPSTGEWNPSSVRETVELPGNVTVNNVVFIQAYSGMIWGEDAFVTLVVET